MTYTGSYIAIPLPGMPGEGQRELVHCAGMCQLTSFFEY